MEATAAGVSTRKNDAEILKTEARGITCSCMVLRRHRPANEDKAEAEGQELVPPMADNVSMMLGTVCFSYSGPRCFAKRIQEEKTPRGMNLKLAGNLKNYDGKERPHTWIDGTTTPSTSLEETPMLPAACSSCTLLVRHVYGSMTSQRTPSFGPDAPISTDGGAGGLQQQRLLGQQLGQRCWCPRASCS
jgi:hypothetical protein